MTPALRTRYTQGDFSAGMNRDVAPALIPDSGIYDLVNALLDEDGNPYRRGGTEYQSKEGMGSAGLTWVWSGYLLGGPRTIFANGSDFGVLGSDDESIVNLGGVGLSAPKQSAVIEDLLYIGGGTLYGGSRKTAVYSTGTVEVTKGSKTVKGAGTTWTANVDVGMLFHIGSERVYVVAEVNSNTELKLRDNYEGTGGSGKAYTLNPLWAIGGSDPYEIWDYVTECANRWVGLVGRTIKFSEVKNPHSYTNQFGTTNEHTLPQGVEGVSISTSGPTVLAGSTGGIWALDGLALDIDDINGNAQHRLQRLSGEIVPAGAAGIAAWSQQLVVPAVDGIYLMDGVSSPVPISKPVERLYRSYMVHGYTLGGATVYKGHYLLPVLHGATVADLLVCRLDRPLRSRSQTAFPWGRLSGDGGELRALAVRNSGNPQTPELLAAQAREPSRLVNCSSYFTPEEGNETDADGTTHNFDLITRDIETGSLTENVIRALKLRYELVEGSGGEPLLKVYWSDGSLEAGGAKWDEVSWDEFDWAGDSGATFNAVGKDGPPSDGRNPETFRVNKRLRYGRFRIKTSGAAAAFALRLLEMDVRPSGATRR